MKTILKVMSGLLLLVAVVLAGWYWIDGQPLPEAAGYLQGTGYTARVEEDGALLFSPAVVNGHGLLIMHGAMIKPLSYARTAAFFAGRGYTVFIPSGFARLSITAVDSAAARMTGMAVRDWVVIGHSMGGFSGLELISRHAPAVQAVALWASAMPADYSSLAVPMLFLRGDHDELLSRQRFTDARSKLPKSVEYVNVVGGNHRGFALYSHQFFDGQATISPDQQIDIANETTARFFAARLPVHLLSHLLSP